MNVHALITRGVCPDPNCWSAYPGVHGTRCRYSTDQECPVCGMWCPEGRCGIDDEAHRAAARPNAA